MATYYVTRRGDIFKKYKRYVIRLYQHTLSAKEIKARGYYRTHYDEPYQRYRYFYNRQKNNVIRNMIQRNQIRESHYYTYRRQFKRNIIKISHFKIQYTIVKETNDFHEAVMESAINQL